MTPADYTPEQLSAFWTAVATGVGAVATVIAAFVAVRTLLALKRDSADRTRPMMSADLRPVTLSQGTSELLVTNLGGSVARNVRVTFTPELPNLQGAEASGKVTPFMRRRYSNTLPTFAPGRRLTNIYAVQVPGVGGALINDEPTPDEIEVAFTYEDDRGTKYQDRYPLTLAMIRDQTSSHPSGGPDTYAKRTVVAVETIAQTLGRES